MLDFSRCRLVPVIEPDGSILMSGVKEHVKVGVQALVDHPVFALFDEMGAMKSAQTIIAAQVLFERSVIDKVLIIAPASVRSVWYDPELGELQKHLWEGLPASVTEWHTKMRRWWTGKEDPQQSGLKWWITNYDFIRAKNRLTQLLPFCDSKTLLVLDESSAIKSHKTQQTTACLQLRRKCGRVVLLNGTPIAEHPGDMFSQGNVMDPRILNCPSYTQFCARYAIMKPILGYGGKPLTSPRGFVIKTVAGWSGIEDIQKRFAPYVLRRLTAECVDMPAKLPPVVMPVVLTPATWRIYREMRDELVVWLSQNDVSMAPQIITKIMRLAQITSGFLGGVEDMPMGEETLGDVEVLHEKSVQEIGREKLDMLLEWLTARWEENANLKVLIWSRFRPEILRIATELRLRSGRDFADLEVGMIIGGQKRADRDYALRLLDPRTMPSGPVAVIGSTSAGSMGLNLTGSHTVIRPSNDYSLKTRLQSDARTHRPGQTWPVSYTDMVATGPAGQKTIDHAVLARLLQKDTLAVDTTMAWVKKLTSE